MIDEELYKQATEELDSDARKPDVWARACALASDDHDEARFLYTNLRVEEMLNTDGKQRTFSSKRHRRATVVPDSEKLALPELETEGAETDEYEFASELEESNTHEGLSSNEPSSKLMPLSSEHLTAELYSDNASSSIEADLTHTDLSGPSAHEKNGLIAKNASSIDVVSEIPSASKTQAQHKTLSPEQQKTSKLTQKLEQQAQSLEVDEHAHTPYTAAQDESATTANINEPVPVVSTSPHPTGEIRNDYVDSKNRLDQVDKPTHDTPSPTGYGSSFQVLERNGAATAIKNGVSWPALLFTFPWLLSKAMIGTAIVYGLLWLVSLIGLYVTGVSWLDAGPQASLAAKIWTLAFATIAVIGLLYIPFRYGNSWLATKLQKRGYELKASISAANKRDAVKRALNTT